MIPARPRRPHLLAACALAVGLAAPIRAQVARGTVVDEDGIPVRTALVVLLDAAGKQRAAVLTDSAGAFVVRAPVPGAYQLRVARLGYRPSAPLPVTLAAGAAAVERHIVAAALPVELPAITAAAKRRCTSQPREGEAVAVLWYEARKALQATQLGGGARTYSFRTLRFIRRLEVPSLRVLADTSQERVEFTRGSPWVSAPVQRLLEGGFIVPQDDGGAIYYAPDAKVLLSDEFAGAYCLMPAEDQEHDRVGIHFQPVERSGPPAVTGTLWLDRASFELRQLVYGYTRADLPEGPVDKLGGTVDFNRLPDGSWVVWKWRIRMPLTALQELHFGGRRSNRVYMIGMREEGAEILEVLSRPDERPVPLPAPDSARAAPLPAGPQIPVTLYLRDRDTGQPVVGAEVLFGTRTSPLLSDSAGAVTVGPTPAGGHTLIVRHAAYGMFRDSIDVTDQPAFEIRLPGQAVPIRALEITARSAVTAARLARGTRADILTRAELEPLASRARHVGDLLRDIPGLTVRELRSARGTGPLRGVCVESGRGVTQLRPAREECASVLLVIDDIPVQPSGAPGLTDLQAETLLNLPPTAIESIEFLNAAEAGPKYGTGAMRGVLVIYTRGKGPYAPNKR
ncbi:MAG: hypothetical protein FIB01_09165 [Gemmatimonadetes bacterium]|nr:hypothetical protein [Gemmatimonadota bacterium]